MGEYKPVTHVIFDMDGLLLNTESLYTIATQNILDEYGQKYTWEVKVKLMGKTSLDAAKRIVEIYNLPITPEKYCELVEIEYDKIFPSAELLPGAEKLIRHLYNHKVPIAISSGSSAKSYALKTTNHKELFSLFSHEVLSSSDPEVKRGKPAPDPFLICAQRFEDKPNPETVLVFEDSPNGVESALAAGMQVVMVPDQRTEVSLTKNATLVLSSLEEFKPELFGLPPYAENS